VEKRGVLKYDGILMHIYFAIPIDIREYPDKSELIKNV
jgi:hypothetical protein